MLFRSRIQPAIVPKNVDIDEEFRGDEEAFKQIERTVSYTKRCLYVVFAIGLFFCVPWPGLKPFWPELSFLVYLPAAIYGFCKLYVNIIKKAFKLIGRYHPKLCMEGDGIRVAFELKYKSFLPFPMAYINDHFRATRNLASPLTILKNEDFDSDGILRMQYWVDVNRGYGKFKIGPMELHVRDPFHFFDEKIMLPLETDLSVWLSPPPQEDVIMLNESFMSQSGSQNSNKAGNGMDFYGIKEYVPGDDIRAICWPKSASIGKIILKQFERNTMPNAFLAIHTDKTQLRGLGFGNTMKRIFRIGAEVIHRTQEKGIPISLALAKDKTATLTDIGSGIPAYGFMTELLGNLEAAEPEASVALMNTIVNKTSPGSIVFILSHTMCLDYDIVYQTFSDLVSRGVKVLLWVIDDSKQLNFSSYQQSTRISKEEFMDNMGAIGVDFRLINVKEEFAREEAFKEMKRQGRKDEYEL